MMTNFQHVPNLTEQKMTAEATYSTQILKDFKYEEQGPGRSIFRARLSTPALSVPGFPYQINLKTQRSSIR